MGTLEPLLPPQRSVVVGPSNHRLIIDGMLWRYRTGSPWRALPTEFGPWETVYSRFWRWQRDGIWQRVLRTLQAAADEAGTLTGTCIVWMHHNPCPSACRWGQKGGEHALGRSRGGFGTKLHVRTDQTGKLITWTLTAGQAGERSGRALLNQGQIGRRRKPKRVAADKGYTGRPVRRVLRRRKIGAVIPRFKTERKQGVRFDREAYKARNVVERCINRLKQYRGIATRYDKLTRMFAAGITVVVMVLFWL